MSLTNSASGNEGEKVASLWNVDNGASGTINKRSKAGKKNGQRSDKTKIIFDDVRTCCAVSKAKIESLEASRTATEVNLKFYESKLLATNKLLMKHLEAFNAEKKHLNRELERTNMKLNYLATKHNESKKKIEVLENANKELQDKVMDNDLKHNRMMDTMKVEVKRTNYVRRKQLAAVVKSISKTPEEMRKGETFIIHQTCYYHIFTDFQ